MDEQPAPGDGALLASSRQGVLTPELEAVLLCVEGYVSAGACDWAHWSEMWETCETYQHPELENGFFIDEVQAGRCTAANWSTLRAQLVASSAPALVRSHCDATSAVVPQSELDGCHTLASADASYVSVAPEKTVTLYAGADCTGDSVVVQADTNLCNTSYASGASANDNVRSFRVGNAEVQASAARYDCDAAESTCVKNYNGNLARVNSTHAIKIVRVTQSGRTTLSITDIKNDLNALYGFYGVASRNQVGLNLNVAHQTVNVPSTYGCEKAKTQATQATTYTTAFLTVYMMPRGLCNYSNAGSRRVYLEDGLQRTYAHEIGHVLGLAHGKLVDDTGQVQNNSDPTTYMAKMPSDNYNLPQLHWLGWTKKEDLVMVNSAIADGSAVDITLRPVDRNAANASGLPLGAVFENSTTGQRLFISVPKSRTTDVNQVDGGGVFIYRAPKCEGCTGMAMGTVRLARFGPKSATGHIVSDLAITPVGYQSHWVVVDGKNVEVFTSVTVRIRRSAPVVLAPADGAVTSSTPTYSGTAQAGLKVNLFVDGVRVATPTATTAGTWSFTPAAALASGAHTVRVSATDAALNLSPTSSTFTFTVP